MQNEKGGKNGKKDDRFHGAEVYHASRAIRKEASGKPGRNGLTCRRVLYYNP